MAIWIYSILANHKCSFYSVPGQHELSLVPLILAILSGVRWNLKVVFICTSLMTKDVEHLFKCFTMILRYLLMDLSSMHMLVATNSSLSRHTAYLIERKSWLACFSDTIDVRWRPITATLLYRHSSFTKFRILSLNLEAKIATT